MGKRGPKPTHPNEETATKVRMLAAYGLTRTDILRVLPISKGTLYGQYAEQIKAGDAWGKMKLAEKGFQKAIQGKGDNQLLIFLLRTRLQWSEPSKMTLTGPNDGPVQTVDLSRCTTEQLEQLKEIMRLTSKSDDPDD